MTDSLIKSFIDKLDKTKVYTYSELAIIASSFKSSKVTEDSKKDSKVTEDSKKDSKVTEDSKKDSKVKKTRYTPDKKEKERIKDILIARRYYWNAEKKEGMRYSEFCSIWDRMGYSEKYSIVDFYENSVKDYKKAKVKPELNEEDKDYNDYSLDKIIELHKVYWEDYKLQSYNTGSFERFQEMWKNMDLDDKESLVSYFSL